MGGLLDNNKSKSILKDAKGKLTLPPALTCALEVASKSEAGPYRMRSVAPVLAVEVEGPGPCIESRSYGFVDLKALFFSVRFISMMHVEGEGKDPLDYISGHRLELNLWLPDDAIVTILLSESRHDMGWK